jgi:glutamine amidotransferase-like uncharacterized protein
LTLASASRPGALAADRPAAPRPLRVGVYDDIGTSRNIEFLLKVLGEHDDLRVDRLDAEQISTGSLDGYDVLIQPGGSGSGQGKALGEEGRERIRDFVRAGGGYLGICAGAYLASSDYSWSLHILDARVVDKKHWARGTGPVEIALTPKGREILGVEAERPTVLYYQGPLLAPAEDASLPDFEVLARFDGEIAKKGAPSGVMKGTTAIAAGTFERGRVLCISPHPERTDGLHGMVYRAILWAARRQAR